MKKSIKKISEAFDFNNDTYIDNSDLISTHIKENALADLIKSDAMSYGLNVSIENYTDETEKLIKINDSSKKNILLELVIKNTEITDILYIKVTNIFNYMLVVGELFHNMLITYAASINEKLLSSKIPAFNIHNMKELYDNIDTIKTIYKHYTTNTYLYYTGNDLDYKKIQLIEQLLDKSETIIVNGGQDKLLTDEIYKSAYAKHVQATYNDTNISIWRSTITKYCNTVEEALAILDKYDIDVPSDKKIKNIYTNCGNTYRKFNFNQFEFFDNYIARTPYFVDLILKNQVFYIMRSKNYLVDFHSSEYINNFILGNNRYFNFQKIINMDGDKVNEINEALFIYVTSRLPKIDFPEYFHF